MAAVLPTADEVLAEVKKLIAELGADAFRTDGRVQLYSGPRRAIGRSFPKTPDNHRRAEAQAMRSRLRTIDDTKISQYLGSLDKSGSLYLYFERHYGEGSKIAFEHADRVLRETSREFIKAAFGHVATAVCGAAPDRIFLSVELPAIVENDAIETINGLPAAMVRDFYRLDPYEAFRLICLAELLEARRYAGSVKPSRLKRQAKREYRERLDFFLRERQATMNGFATAPRDQMAHLKLAKRHILSRYKIMEDMAAIIGTEPVLPPAAMLMRRVHAVSPHSIA